MTSYGCCLYLVRKTTTKTKRTTSIIYICVCVFYVRRVGRSPDAQKYFTSNSNRTKAAAVSV